MGIEDKKIYKKNFSPERLNKFFPIYNGKFNELIDELIASGVSPVKKKVYVATLTQSGTNPPVAEVLENTLDGTPVWSRNVAGSYYMTLTGAFTEGKTVVYHNTTGTENDSIIHAYWEDVDTIYYETLSGGLYEDDKFYNNHTLRIEVYE
ncbi:MAG: hypothetical protein V3S79_05660 [Candidatus Thermoplasmatota archaeon]